MISIQLQSTSPRLADTNTVTLIERYFIQSWAIWHLLIFLSFKYYHIINCLQLQIVMSNGCNLDTWPYTSNYESVRNLVGIYYDWRTLVWFSQHHNLNKFYIRSFSSKSFDDFALCVYRDMRYMWLKMYIYALPLTVK